MIIESTHARADILNCLRSCLNRIGYSIVWAEAKEIDKYFIYVFEGFMTRQRANAIQVKVFDNKLMHPDCVCMIRLTKAPYKYEFKPAFDEEKKSKVDTAVIYGFDNMKIKHKEPTGDNYGGAKTKIAFDELIKLPRFKETI